MYCTVCISAVFQVGRRSLDQLVRNLLVSDKVGESLVKGLVEVFGRLHPANARITQLAEIISEVREPVVKMTERPLSEEEKRKRKLQVLHNAIVCEGPLLYSWQKKECYHPFYLRDVVLVAVGRACRQSANHGTGHFHVPVST